MQGWSRRGYEEGKGRGEGGGGWLLRAGVVPRLHRPRLRQLARANVAHIPFLTAAPFAPASPRLALDEPRCARHVDPVRPGHQPAGGQPQRAGVRRWVPYGTSGAVPHTAVYCLGWHNAVRRLPSRSFPTPSPSRHSFPCVTARAVHHTAVHCRVCALECHVTPLIRGTLHALTLVLLAFRRSAQAKRPPCRSSCPRASATSTTCDGGWWLTGTAGFRTTGAGPLVPSCMQLPHSALRPAPSKSTQRTTAPRAACSRSRHALPNMVYQTLTSVMHLFALCRWVVLILFAYILVFRVGSVLALKYWNFLRR